MDVTCRLLDAALKYVAYGWAVLPLKPGAKTPLTEHGFKDASKDRAQIRAWWTECPNANVGVATGAISGITVLDVDIKPRKSVYGDRTLAALIAAHGDLPLTATQQTWSGGRHHVFAYVPGVKNSVSRLGDGLDVRSDGGYICVAPSMVNEESRSGAYRWLADDSPFERAPAVMPSWLLAMLQPATTGNGPSKAPRSIAEWATVVGGVPEGHRQEELARVAGLLYAKHPPKLARAFARSYGKGCEPPLTEVEVDACCDRIEKREAGRRLTIQVGTDGELAPEEKPLSEGGDAERLVFLYGDRFRWVAEEKTWLAWDGKRWGRDKVFEVQRLARETVVALQAAGLALESPQARKKVLGHALRADSARGIDGMVKVARYLPGVTVLSEALDTNRDTINVENGTLDLRTFTLKPHDPTEMLTRLVNVPYDAGAVAPTWRKFLADVFRGKPEVIEYVQRCVGYTLTGAINEQVVFFLHGAGANGKSTFVGVLDALLGDYAVNAGKETFLASSRNEGRGPEPELMRLAGKRFAYVDEIDEGRSLDEGRIKALTGGESTTARDLYKTTETFRNTTKIWFDLNTLPDFKGVDYGIERRLIVIPFDRKFSDEEKDETMLDKLKAELPGILAWAVEGCKAWRARALSVDKPVAVELATRRYRDEQNHLPAFVEEFYTLVLGDMVAVSTLQQDYASFCTTRGEPQLSYQHKLRPYLRDVLKLEITHTRKGSVISGLAPRPNQQAAAA
jgi:putative DNA primase/helicase